MKTSVKAAFWAVMTVLGLGLIPSQVSAIPSFARQTGMSCAACHTVFPELTTYGRTFKLNGYTTNNSDSLKDGSDEAGYRLNISNTPPISAMLQLADTFPSAPPSGTISNGSDGKGLLEFPTEFSIFYGGALSTKAGAFIQLTYDAGSIGFDNSDIRIADRFQLGDTDLVLGMTLNNNPTVQDVFNSTPAWGFPYSGGSAASVASQMEMGAGVVGGLGVYAFWNQMLYAEITAYRSMTDAADPVIQGYAPYWRVAFTKDFDKHSIEVGAYGLTTHTYAMGTPTLGLGDPDNISDFAVDAQYQYVGKEVLFTAKGNYTTENQKWDFTNPGVEDTFTSLKLDGTFYYDRKIGASVGYFRTTGTADPVLYGAFANNVPDSAGIVLELNYVPWYNTKFSFQYTSYSKFDGDELTASDNNALRLSAWLMI